MFDNAPTCNALSKASLYHQQTSLTTNKHHLPPTTTTNTMTNTTPITTTTTMSTNLTQEPQSYDSSSPPVSPSTGRRMSAHAEADAARAISHTNNWTPVFEHCHKWNSEDRKHAMHMVNIGAVKTGPGFTERP
ncbi:hypothetical protein BGZ61DRAFT_532636 [Ilyonectria robusta]|uniref:uncharacterized protein n=1 Tax=Ilyonectria robusta TaxID=1079257 RepID=UPI001E8DB25F|nr:uncharacterized protein BGZ61DRAFT_532636 [Ilyonectria robusta]KAH8694567.1 hypothetical protein BGZ61DRAFT_532636 [Ilyonectria robusta]